MSETSARHILHLRPHAVLLYDGSDLADTRNASDEYSAVGGQEGQHGSEQQGIARANVEVAAIVWETKEIGVGREREQ
jgi:hypothetical protein